MYARIPYDSIELLLLCAKVFFDVDLILEIGMESLHPILFILVDALQDGRDLLEHILDGFLVWLKSGREGHGRIVSQLIPVLLVVRFGGISIEKGLCPAFKERAS
jgi:hypothetical protein